MSDEQSLQALFDAPESFNQAARNKKPLSICNCIRFLQRDNMFVGLLGQKL
jgi:hypothetical protein